MKRLLIYCAALLAVLFATTAIFAQSFEAKVVGNVTDPTGAAIVGASVTITEDGTGLEQTATTGSDGNYTILQLRPSTYTLKVEATGFKTFQQKSLVLEANQTGRVDVVMKVGATQEEVTVVAEASSIHLDDSKKGENIVNRQVQDLPLNGRDFQDLAMLVPGVYPKPSDDDQGQGYSTSGTRTDATNFTLDGVNNRQDRTGGVGVNTSIDSIQEFNVSTSSYSAEYGRQAGAQVSVVSKSGTNTLHGSFFDYVRSDIIDAQNYQGGASALRRQQFGGALGGRIIKDKLFYFGSYEGTRQAQSETADLNAPNADWLGRGPSGLVGDFRDLLAPNSWDIQNPYATSAPTIMVNGVAQKQWSQCSQLASVYQQFGPHQCEVGYNTGGSSNFKFFSQNGGINNVIPASMLSPTSLAMLPFIPAANQSGGLEGYTADGLHYTNRNQYLAKLDYRLSSSNSMYLRWARQQGNEYDPFPSSRNYYPHMGGVSNPLSDSIAFSLTTTINNSTVNEARLGWYYQHNVSIGQNQNQDYNALFGIPGVSQGAYWEGFPSVRIDGYAEMGDRHNYPYVYFFKNLQAADTLTMVRGKHTFKFGADVARNNYFEIGDDYMRGDFRFRGKDSSYGAVNTPDPWAFADFLMGTPDSSQRQVGNIPSNLRGFPMGFFGQDDWKILPSLTLNLGLRYELFLPNTDASNNLVNYIPVTKALPGCPTPNLLGSECVQAIIPGTPGYPNSLVFTNWRNISPRVGFAWRIFNDDKTVLRGGGGVFYSQEMYNVSREQLALNFDPNVPSKDWQTYSRNSGDPCQLQMGIPSEYCASDPLASNWTSSLMARNIHGIDPHGRTPQVFQYNLTLEQQLAPDLTWEIGYVGNISHFLGRWYDANQLVNPKWNCSSTTDPSTGLQTASCKAVGTNPYSVLVDQNGNAFPAADQILVKASGSAQTYIYQVQDGNSNYNALQTSLRRRSKGGLTLLASYTFSRMIDTASSTNTSTSGSQKYPQNSWNLPAERAASDLNRTHQFTVAMNYALPIGRGHWLGSNGGKVMDAFVSNWQLNAKGSVLTGRPYTVQYNATDFTSERPNQVSDPMVPGVVLANPDPTCQVPAGQLVTLPNGQIVLGRAPMSLGGLGGMVFNPCAYAKPGLQADLAFEASGYNPNLQPTMSTYGTVGRNSLIGPTFFDLDLGISKNFKVTRLSDKARIQFRIETFNLLNHPNFQIPNYLLDQPNVATYKTMAGNNRVFQAALKVLF